MGRKQFETIVASAPRERLVTFEVTQTAQLAASASESILIYANAGTICKVIGMYIAAGATLAGATSGTHYFKVGCVAPIVTFMEAQTAFDKAIYFDSSHWLDADTKIPADIGAQTTILNNIYFDSTQPLKVVYGNSTNGTQIGNRIIRVLAVEKTLG